MRFGNAVHLCVVAALCCAQTPPPQEIASSRETPTTFSTRVNLVVVPVVVRDKKGHAIGTLTKEDFQLFDKGKPQTISRFTVEKAGEKAASEAAQLAATAVESGVDPSFGSAAIPTRFVAYLFDDLRISPGDLSQVRTAAIKHLTETLHPTDRVAIYTTSGINNLDFTDDAEKMIQALNHISPRPHGASALDCPPMTLYMADLIQNHSDAGALQVAVSDATICLNMMDSQGLEGTNPGLPATPGGQQMAVSMSQAAASRTIAQGEYETQISLSVLKDVVRRMSASPGQRSVIVISPGFMVTQNYRQDEMELVDRAIRANVTIGTLDARGLYTLDSSADATQPYYNVRTQTAKNLYLRASAQADEDVLAEIAEGTGGTFFHNNNDYGEGLKRTAAAPEFIYLIAFSPQNLKYDGSFHNVKVTLKPRDFNMQARRGYYAPKHAANEEEQAKQEIREAIFSREEIQEFPVTIQTQFFKPTADTARLSVVARIDMKLLRFQKVQGRNTDTLIITNGLFDRNGNLVKTIQKTVEMRIKDETFETHMKAGLNVKTSFDVQPGKYVLRLVVRDSEGQMMSARNGIVDIP